MQLTRNRLLTLPSSQVAFAKKNGSIIVYDAAYALYISDPNCPKTIYEIPGACPERGGSLVRRCHAAAGLPAACRAAALQPPLVA